jgi:cytochrome P450
MGAPVGGACPLSAPSAFIVSGPMRGAATFLDEYRASRAPGTSAAAEDAVLREWLTLRADAVLEDIRASAPDFALPGLAFVTGYHDVCEVLQRSDVFSVAPYGEAMARINRGPSFLLGMDDGPEYRRQLERLASAFHPDDDDGVRACVSLRASETLAAAAVVGRLDLVGGFGRLVPSLVLGEYFGVPGPDPTSLMRWARAIFTDAFVNVLGVPLLSRRAMRASLEFRVYLDELIAATHVARDGGQRRDDVLGRLLVRQEGGDVHSDDAWIRDSLLWCVAGVIDNVNAAVCRVVDRWLDDPELLAAATAAARDHDTSRLQSLVFETLRLHASVPVVIRRSVRAYTLGGARHQQTRIPADTTVFVGLGTAMTDPSVVERPGLFRLDRPAEHYLHFGAGIHHCLGRRLAVALVTEMAAALLRMPHLRRTDGLDGRLLSVGPFPTTFIMDVRPS